MASENVQLDSGAEQFFRTVEGLKFPQALIDSHPHIANAIYRLRSNRIELRKYFDTLTNDMRGNRQGFQFGVLMNIQDLREAMIGDNTGFVSDDTTKWVS